jgi:pyruvate dehydrogenase E2 component (dihydrolipoamide acetyltransferase)
MSETEVKVPNIGDFKDVEVIEVLVSEGQILKKNDPLITIESDKSSVEIPSNFEGKIKSLRTKVGDKVSEGDLILILDSKSKLNEIAEEKPEIEKEFKKIKVIKPETEQTQTNELKLLLMIFHLQVQKLENLRENSE